MLPHIRFKTLQSIRRFTHFATWFSLITCGFCLLLCYYTCKSEQSNKCDGQTWADDNCTFHFPSFCLTVIWGGGAFWAQRTCCLKQSYVHDVNETLPSHFHHLIGLYLQDNSVFFFFYLLLHFLVKMLDLIIMCSCFSVWRKTKKKSGLPQSTWMS